MQKETEAVTMVSLSLSGLTSKLTSNADTLGYLAALVAGSDRPIEDIISSIQQIAAGVIHAPDIGKIQEYLQSQYFKNAVYGYIGGVAIDSINPPIVGKYGKALEKGAMAYGVGSFALYLLYAMTHSPIKGTNIENSNSVQQNIMNAPLASAYY